MPHAWLLGPRDDGLSVRRATSRSQGQHHLRRPSVRRLQKRAGRRARLLSASRPAGHEQSKGIVTPDIVIGSVVGTGAPATINVPILLRSGMLVQSNSGGAT